MVVSKGIGGPVSGERVQLATKTHSLSSVIDARDGTTWLESALPQHNL